MGKILNNESFINGLIIVLGSEFLLRNVFLPENASDFHVGVAILVEWFILLVLLAFWVPKIEKGGLESVGFGKFKRRYLWVSVVTYFVLLLCWAVSGIALNVLGLEGLRSLQPTIQEHSYPILSSLFLTGTFLEEVFYRGYLIERLTLLTGRSWLAGLVSWVAFTLFT